MISMVLERKVWTFTKGRRLYPNLYIVLTALPGIGKSFVLSPAEEILRALPDVHVSPSSLTNASLVDALVLAKRSMTVGGTGVVDFNSLQVIASELGVFLPAYDPAFMNTLTKVYDGEHYEERRRTGKVNHLIIERPLLSILGGTTPSYINSFLPDGAWDQGFTSRTIFISGTTDKVAPLFGEVEGSRNLFSDLIHDLQQICQYYGVMKWTKDAMDTIEEWYLQKLPPIPKHAKLVNYNSRRLAHILKLCTVASISRSSNMEIDVDDFLTARRWLLDAETHMPDIFGAMVSGGDSRSIEDCRYFIWKEYGKSGKAVGHHLIVAFLRDRVPTYAIDKIIDSMVQSQDIQRTTLNNVLCYTPVRQL